MVEKDKELPDLVIESWSTFIRIYTSNIPTHSMGFPYSQFETPRGSRLAYDRLERMFKQHGYDLKETMTFNEFHHYVQSQVKRRDVQILLNQ
ncbi:MAG: hypothetical protein V1944_00655 [Candidatus Aenigmatarchaeota archaeon]